MLNFSDFIKVYVFSTNHHLNVLTDFFQQYYFLCYLALQQQEVVQMIRTVKKLLHEYTVTKSICVRERICCETLRESARGR